jgi:hypothetical protein
MRQWAQSWAKKLTRNVRQMGSRERPISAGSRTCSRRRSRHGTLSKDALLPFAEADEVSNRKHPKPIADGIPSDCESRADRARGFQELLFVLRFD